MLMTDHIDNIRNAIKGLEVAFDMALKHGPLCADDLVLALQFQSSIKGLRIREQNWYSAALAREQGAAEIAEDDCTT